MTAPLLIGTSLKMYFGYQQTLDWCRQVTDIARRHPAVTQGHAALFIMPSFPTLAPVLEMVRGTDIRIGAQNLSDQPPGAWTGEVSAAMLAEMGCRCVEIGHAERRRHFHEDETLVAAKTALAMTHGLSPVLCVGEGEEGDPEAAASECIRQMESALAETPHPREADLIVAYEPHWAIGASQPASSEHISAVCMKLQAYLDGHGGGCVIYGGSAGPGLLSRLEGSVQGMFLGRFVHDARAFEQILDEVMTLHAASR
ncbi:triose-phosphate isomerase family protein [Kushneria indalinina]|uniref:Triosephosphate isomerase n=1 Tax=Kushneria indalinina DSM 14324 TaxID=1122140 RepID=A0A3D9DYK7_9GAMM|nr:triose-phosphate isomerase family protein [Kushneria indalinina]REC95344.1 triosephosphate isomerase [Kushneria indalinina DSM 14324]